MTTDALPLDTAEEEFCISGKDAEGQKSKYDFSGNFLCEINDIKAGFSKSLDEEGKPKRKFEVTLTGVEGPALGLLFTDHQPPFKTAEMCKQLGIIKEGEDLKFKPSQVVGKQIVVRFKSEVYEKTGKASAKIQGFSPVGTSDALPEQSASSDDIPF